MDLKILIITVSKSAKDDSITTIENIDANRDGLMLLFEKQNPKSIHNPNLVEFGTELTSFLNEITNDDILLVYYAGHGLKDPNKRTTVYLETYDSMRSDLQHTSYDIKNFVTDIQNSVAKRKIIIIDSCYSGAAHPYDNIMGIDDGDNDDFLKEHIEKSKYTGVYILTSTKKNEPARYPGDKPKEPTFFTGELLHILNNGLEDYTKESINCNDLFNELKERLKNKKKPEPCQSNYGNVHDLPFWPNNSYNPDIAKPTSSKAYQTNSSKETTNKTYTISYKIDNVVIKQQEIQFNSLIKHIDAPQKNGYTFSGWQCEYTTMPAYDVVVTGRYKKNINWKRIMTVATGLVAIAIILYYISNRNDNTNTTIYTDSFYGRNDIEQYVVPEGIEYIEAEAFRECTNLKEITLPKSLKRIGSDAFRDCKSLHKVNIPNSLNEIFGNPFIGVDDLNISFDNGSDNNGYYKKVANYLIDLNENKIVSYLGNQAIVNNFPSECTSIGEYAFSERKTITEIDMSSSNINSIGDFSFEQCVNLKSLKLPENLKQIGMNPFCNIHAEVDDFSNESIVLEDGVLVDKINRLLVAYIGNSNEVNLNIKNLFNAKESIRTIGCYAFEGCGFIKTFVTDNISIDNICSDSGLTEEQIQKLK